MKVDLTKMSVKELEKLKADVEKALSAREQKRLKDAQKEIEAVAKKFGVSVAEVLGGGAPAPKRKRRGAAAKKAPLPAKYKNPKDSSQTWSGRGRQPEWFKAAIKGGKAEKDLLV
ncbi:MAG: H-NS histone family protein [Pseudomonadota bacterium]